ncbi:MAG: phosphoribosyltransferase [Pedosphaera sp.]|nr:phosphoribosyltransferase [Pedosphaera sp.]
MIFSSREAAGVQLGQHLLKRGVEADIVLGLPRGGVVVAAEVAHILKLPLDVLVVRKIGHPQFREFAVGALAEHGVVLLDRVAMEETRVSRSELEDVIAEETERLKNYRAKFHHAAAPSLSGKNVLIVDDGLATGATTEAAVTSAREQGSARVIVAAPVASVTATDRLARIAREVIVLESDPDFAAVGQYYSSFSQTSDEEVLALLQAPAI